MSGDRHHEILGDEGSVALRFDDPRLQDRWAELIGRGATWRWPFYKPHVTFKVDPDFDLTTVEPYPGELRFGPEVWKELGDEWRDEKDERLAKAEWDESEHPRKPKGDPEGGEWTSAAAEWKNPTQDQLERAQRVFRQLTDGATAKFIDRQMRGGKLIDGRFTPFTDRAKAANLRAMRDALDRVRERDPEAYEMARRWALAEELGAKDYDDLPGEVTVYRGHDADEKLGRGGVNVTAKREVAEKFGESSVVSEYRVAKGDIGFTLHASAFDEGEMVVFSAKSLREVGRVESETVRLDRKLAAIEPGSTVSLRSGEKVKFVSRGVGNSSVVEHADGSRNYALDPNEIA